MRTIKFIIVNVLNVYFKRREILSLNKQKEEIVEGKQKPQMFEDYLAFKKTQ